MIDWNLLALVGSRRHNAGRFETVRAMSHTQPSLFGDDQPDLFGPAPDRPQAYRVKPQHVINRFIEFHDLMAKADRWPWDADHVDTLKTRTWPYLLGKLREIGCAEEAARWQTAIDAEAARLDAASAA